MIVDDEPANTLLLERLFQLVDLPNCRSTNDSRQAVDLFLEYQPDVVLLDLSMPHLDGFEVMNRLKSVIPVGDYLPILVLTADATERAKQRALSSGANDFLTKPFNTSEVVLRVRNLLETRRLHLQMRRCNENLESIVADRTSELRQALGELKETQQQVIQQERLRALGTMASGVAHDFNNALSIILGFGEFVLQSCRKEPAMSEAAEQMEIVINTAEDAAKIVGRLRSFYSTAKDLSERPVDLKALVKQAVAITEPRWKTQPRGKGIEITVHMALDETPPIWGHAHELREVLTNLIFNAVDAMPEGGTLTFRSGVEDRAVFVSITDSGTGMTEDVRRQCLEPFFTTKGEQGSGLGLAMVYGIVQRHQGELDIQTGVGQGTTFVIRFPAQTSDDEHACEDSPAGVERPLQILVVEDQDVIREIVVEHIGSDLHTIATAADAEEALSKLQSTPFDLVVTDQAMPGMSGDQLSAVIKRDYPGTRVILLTGFGNYGNEFENVPTFDLVLGKPISKEAFRTGIARVMATPPARARHGALADPVLA